MLLTFPFLYRIKSIYYETNLQENDGINELLAQLNKVANLKGNIVECGSSRCGTSIIMANYLRLRKIHKIIYACDSFEGFDYFELEREKTIGLTKESEKAFTSTSFEYVNKKIEKLKIENMVIPIKGFFQDTLSHIEDVFCFALIDCDLKDSTIFCAETIWSKLINNGRIVFDDYIHENFKGVQVGVDFFLDKYKNQISEHGLMKRLYYVCKK